jgi:hypothetical protein
VGCETGYVTNDALVQGISLVRIPEMAFIAELVDKIRALVQDLADALFPAKPQVAVQPVRSDDERIFRA